MSDVFKFNSTLEIINHKISNSEGQVPHGAKNKMAKIINCHPTYVAQILKDSVKMSQEQALLFCKQYVFNEVQADYFLILLNIERAGTEALKKYYITKKEKLISSLGPVGRSLKSVQLYESIERDFFSNWDYQALYAAITLYGPKKNAKKLSEYLGIDLNRTNEIINKFMTYGLISRKGNAWIVNKSKVHFNGKNLEVKQKFHLAWRLKSIQQNFMSSTDQNSNFNFSSLITLNSVVHEKLIDEIKKLINNLSEELDQIESESISVLNIDLFKLGL